LAAVELLKELEALGKQATPAQQAVLAKFIGWGSSEIANNLFGKKLDAAAEAIKSYEEAKKYFAENGGRPLLAALRKAYAKFTEKHGKINQFKSRRVKVKVVDPDTAETYTDEEEQRVYARQVLADALVKNIRGKIL
jgi:hypothetical protein